MYRTATSHRMLGFAATTAMAALALTGCTTAGAPNASASASKAEAALASGKHSRAVEYAEAAVLAEPRNAAYRTTLGAAYLDAGRFASAATSFEDARQLGDTSPRTALSLALAHIALGQNAEAAEILNQNEDRIATADVGLALALAGQPERGVHLMSTAIRGGENNAKIRQNLAYAYALTGHWREARLMAEQDVPRSEVNLRMEQWAISADPRAYQYRVAMLLQAPAGVSDAGQPVQLALANTPGVEQLAAEAVAEHPAAVVEASGELPPVAEVAQAEPPALAAPELPVLQSPVQTALSTPAPVMQDASRFVSEPVVQPAAASRNAAPKRAAAATPAATPAAQGTHLVQLGSFSSEQGARKAWNIYLKRYPELTGHQMVISEAVVKGKRYWRVSAAGFGKAASSAMRGKVKARGEGCFAYAQGRPLPGAVDTGVRLAQR
jgi:Flp pilus assembly protein TadD